MKAIVHFTRDLRIEDQAAIAAAARAGSVVPVVVVDTAACAALRASPRRAAFYCSALAALEAAIAQRGGRLIVRRGRTAPTLRALARAVGAGQVIWSASYSARGVRADRELQAALEESGIRAAPVHDA